MDTFELKREQKRLAPRIKVQDTFSHVKTIAGAACHAMGSSIVAGVVVCEFPSMKILESATFELPDALPHRPGFVAYREMPAIMEAFNMLDIDPDVIMVQGPGIAHPRRFGIASHIGLNLNKPTIGVAGRAAGPVENAKVLLGNEVVGFEVTTREHSKPVYISPGHMVSLGSTLNLVKETIRYPHKLPEPIHLASKVARKHAKGQE